MPDGRPLRSTGSGRFSRQEIRFVTKDTRTKRTVETTYTPAEFLATLADHVPDRYRHNVRYFGLLAPRVKCQTHDAVFALLGQERLGKPRRLWWAASLQNSFGVDPLLDHNGQRMRWTRRVPPAPAGVERASRTQSWRSVAHRLTRSQTNLLHAREKTATGLCNPSASRDLTTPPPPDTGLVRLTAHASRPLRQSPAA